MNELGLNSAQRAHTITCQQNEINIFGLLALKKKKKENQTSLFNNNFSYDIISKCFFPFSTLEFTIYNKEFTKKMFFDDYFVSTCGYCFKSDEQTYPDFLRFIY